MLSHQPPRGQDARQAGAGGLQMHHENQPDDAIPRPGLEIDLEALQRDLAYELVYP